MGLAAGQRITLVTSGCQNIGRLLSIINSSIDFLVRALCSPDRYIMWGILQVLSKDLYKAVNELHLSHTAIRIASIHIITALFSNTDNHASWSPVIHWYDIC